MHDVKTVSMNTWLGIVVLALSTFTIVTAELVPVGLLTPMALGLQQPEAFIGLTVTMYAWVGALSATSIVFGGVSAASVFGVPMANAVGLYADWRLAFWLVAILSMVTLIGMALFMPNIKSTSSIGLDAVRKVLKNNALWRLYTVTLLAITAHFCAFTFIEPYLHSVRVVNIYFMPILLFCFGVAGLIGNVITGWLIDRHLKLIFEVAMGGTALVLFGLGMFASTLTIPAVFRLMMLWGCSVSGLFVGLQTWVLRLARQDAFPASALYVSFFNMAIGLGALLGAWLISRLGLNILMVSAGSMVSLALILIMATPERFNLMEKE